MAVAAFIYPVFANARTLVASSDTTIAVVSPDYATIAQVDVSRHVSINVTGVSLPISPFDDLGAMVLCDDVLYVLGESALYAFANAPTPVLSETFVLEHEVNDWIIAVGSSFLILPWHTSGIQVVDLSGNVVAELADIATGGSAAAYDATAHLLYVFGHSAANGVVIAVNPSTGALTAITGFAATNAREPHDACIQSGILYVASGNRIIAYTLTGDAPTYLSSTDYGQTVNGILLTPDEGAVALLDTYATAFDPVGQDLPLTGGILPSTQLYCLAGALSMFISVGSPDLEDVLLTTEDGVVLTTEDGSPLLQEF